jgi:hypothetical protein
MQKSLLVVFVSLLLVTACGRKEATASATSVHDAPPVAASAAGGTVQAPRAAARALITTADIHVTTEDVGGASLRIRKEVEGAGGYVSDASESGSGRGRTAMLEVRLPSDKTKSIRAALADFGTITSDNEKVEDVTEARADLKARLQNARAQEKRILEIMTSRTGSLAEVIQAENELARVRENIERFEAQERSMEGRIALATVKIHLNGPLASTNEPEAWQTPGTSIAHAFSVGLRGAAALAVYIAMTLAMGAPILLPIGIVVAAIVTIVRRRRAALLAAAG